MRATLAAEEAVLRQKDHDLADLKWRKLEVPDWRETREIDEQIQCFGNVIWKVTGLSGRVEEVEI